MAPADKIEITSTPELPDLTQRTWQKANLPDDLVFAGRSNDSAPHLSRGFKIEDMADTDIPKLFSYAALSHAISGSIGGNVAMSGIIPSLALLCIRMSDLIEHSLLPAGPAGLASTSQRQGFQYEYLEVASDPPNNSFIDSPFSITLVWQGADTGHSN
jgi:hypothetical protein